MGDVKCIAREKKVSVILATHPSKILNRQQPPSLDDIAGGAAVSRFAHKVLWIQNHVIPTMSTVKNYDFTMEVEHNRTLHILKSRDTAGQGMKIAMNFESDLRFHEKGVLLASKGNEPKKSKGTSAMSEFTQRAAANAAKKNYTTEPNIHDRYDEDEMAF
jgi:hypothetical protein